ncbi:NUDIX hydrolase [Candidatus Roizmanbacteria bacterium RIFCSPHIGHO2_01_FULL_35_10]|nr:MAG: NUDIX hydrolase [Candidatus Roizmanbacteria bacterium RIFCSPHIGHO2_01_FULL_35_10]
MEIKEVIEILEKYVSDPSKGLPDEVFFYISRTTPLVNVDLLIKDENGRTLLSWRDDEYTGKGWHIPGGIIRFKETLETRIKKVAKLEIGVDVQFNSIPIVINQIINKHNTRGHFISILYKCFLSKNFFKNKKLSENNIGYLMWHDNCPNDLLKSQEIYREYINKKFN